MRLKNIYKINYENLNAKQKENYNFQKLSAILADYGFVTIKLNDDWQGADFIAQNYIEDIFLKVQLKGRLTLDKKYIGKNLFIAFCDRSNNIWYIYPHDEMLNILKNKIESSTSWTKEGSYTWPSIPKNISEVLNEYII